MNNKTSVNDSVHAELKSVSPLWNNPEQNGIRISNSCIADLYVGEKPVYKTKNGVEIEEWELPNLPDAYLEQVCWPENTPMDVVANEGLTLVRKAGNRYLRPLNRAKGIYAQNKIDIAGLSMIINFLDGYGTTITGIAAETDRPDAMFLATQTTDEATAAAASGFAPTYSIVASGTVSNISGAEFVTQGSAGAAFTSLTSDTTSATPSLTNACNRITYQMTSGTGAGNNVSTWQGAGLCHNITNVANSLLFNYVLFGDPITKGADDTLALTMNVTIGG